MIDRTAWRRMVEEGPPHELPGRASAQGQVQWFERENYRIRERIDQGSTGTVYLAEHLRMRHRVALKILPHEHTENPALRKQFHREVNSTALLSHPNLVRAHDIDEEAGVHYLVMEEVEGTTLHELMTRRSRLTVERGAHEIGQAAVGLQDVHEAAGLVHRDIKPGNLLVDRSRAKTPSSLSQTDLRDSQSVRATRPALPATTHLLEVPA